VREEVPEKETERERDLPRWKELNIEGTAAYTRGPVKRKFHADEKKTKRKETTRTMSKKSSL